MIISSASNVPVVEEPFTTKVCLAVEELAIVEVPYVVGSNNHMNDEDKSDDKNVDSTSNNDKYDNQLRDLDDKNVVVGSDD